MVFVTHGIIFLCRQRSYGALWHLYARWRASLQSNDLVAVAMDLCPLAASHLQRSPGSLLPAVIAIMWDQGYGSPCCWALAAVIAIPRLHSRGNWHTTSTQLRQHARVLLLASTLGEAKET